MSELSSFVIGILGTVSAALMVSIILGIVWMRKAIADQKEAHNLMDQRLKYNENALADISKLNGDRLDKIEAIHDTQYKDLSIKMDQTLAVLTDIKLAFSEVRMKSNNNEARIDKNENRIETIMKS